MPAETVAQALCWSDKQFKTMGNDISSEQRIRRAALEKRDDPAIQGLPLEEILKIFIDRLQQNYKSVQKSFKIFDYENQGEITLSDFCGVINFFLMPMSSALFHQVLQKLDIDASPNCKIQYIDFLQKCCNTKIANSSQGEMPPDCLPVIQRIKNNILNPDAKLRSIFKKIDPKDDTWQVSREEFKKSLETGFELHLSEDEFKELMTLLDPGNTNVINCKDFFKLFQSPCSEANDKEPEKIKIILNKEKYLHLKGDKLQSKFKHYLNKSIKDIEKAILVCDPYQSGYITPVKLQNIVDNLCFPLTRQQFEDIICKFRTYRNCLNYKEFLDYYRKNYDDDTKKWVGIVNKLAKYKSRCPPQLPIDEIEEMLKECVQSKKGAMLKDFKSLDMCNVGVVFKDDVKNILNKHAYRFSDKQFQQLWKKFPRNKFDQLLYDSFLREYSSTTNQETIGHLKEKCTDKQVLRAELCKEDSMVQKEINPNIIKQESKPVEIRKSAKEMLLDQAPQLRKTIEFMEPSIVRNIRSIRYYVHRADPKMTRTVDFTVLANILAKSGIHLSPEDEFHILEHFDTMLTGKINYAEFLKIFVWYA